MIPQTFQDLIAASFAKTGVDKKYFPQYEAEAKRRYELFRKDFPLDEDPTYEENNAIKSISLANDYIAFYVQEAEKGHGHKWAHFYALRSVYRDVEFKLIHYVLNNIDDIGEKDKELTIHARSINKDPIFVERFKYIVKNSNCNYSEKAVEYCHAYHKCIEEGKSEIYAHAYADAVNNGFQGYSGIYAEAYEQAKNQGMNDDKADRFGVFCKCAAENDLYSDIEIENFKKIYQEKWQREFYLQLIEQEHKTELSEDGIISLKKRLGIPIMGEKEIKDLVEKFRRKGEQERKYGAEKCADFNRAAGQIEEYIDTYEDDRFETEEDIIEDVRETFDEVDSFYDDIDNDELDNYELQ